MISRLKDDDATDKSPLPYYACSLVKLTRT